MHQGVLARIVAICLCVVTCVGCGTQDIVQVHNDEMQIVTQEVKQPVLTNEVNYVIPLCKVNVLIDRNGYQSKKNKKALFVGQGLAKEFFVVNADTREIVFTGEIQEETFDDKNEVVISKGDFSEVTDPGKYYIETAIIGRSYTFEIVDDYEEDLLHNLILSSHMITYQETPEDVYELSLCMYAYLQALQFHGSIFDKDSELVTWLLKTASLVMTAQDELGSIGEDFQSTAAFCGAMLMCSHNFEKYDKELSTSYQKAAQNAWNWLLAHRLEEDKNAMFYAAAAKFHCSMGADLQSKEIVLTYFKDAKDKLVDTYFGIFGSILYLSTEKGTDRDLCHLVMQEFMAKTEMICEKEKQHPFLICDTEPSENMKQLMLISFVDYVSPSNEYAVLMENAMHYYGGRNYDGNAYLSMEGIWVNEEYEKDSTPIWNGIMINCLGSLIDDND